MAFPQTLDPASPASGDSPAAGDNQIRDFKQFLADVLALPVSPSTIASKFPTTVGVEAVSDAEATTSSTGGVDIKSITVNLTTGEGALLLVNLRKTGGAAAAASVGLKLNTTQVVANFAWSSASDQVESGLLIAFVWQQTVNYLRGGYVVTAALPTATIQQKAFDTAAPNAALTSLVITGLVGSASITMGVADAVVYKLAKGS